MIAVIYDSAQRFYLSFAPKGNVTAKHKHASFRMLGQNLSHIQVSKLSTHPSCQLVMTQLL